jgi:Flp pilus assembly pilin Flp
MRLPSLRNRLRTTDSGATLVEYALLVALIALGYSVASSMLGTAVLWAVAPRP